MDTTSNDSKWHSSDLHDTEYATDKSRTRYQILPLDYCYAGMGNRDIIFGIRDYLWYYTELYFDSASDLCLIVRIYFYRVKLRWKLHRIYNVQPLKKRSGNGVWYAFNHLFQSSRGI